MTVYAQPIAGQALDNNSAMGASYELWLSRDDGTRLASLDMVSQFEYTMAFHQVGTCKLVLPDTVDRTMLNADRRVEIWRAPAGARSILERVYLLRKFEEVTDSNGVRTYVLTGYDGNDLLRRRIVDYPGGTAWAEKTDEADDMCKAIVRENLSDSCVNNNRKISTTYLTIAEDTSQGPTLTDFSFPFRNVLTVLQEIAEAADTAGTPIYWDMVPVSRVQWQFQTWTGQPGVDHTYVNRVAPVIVGQEYGTLQEPTLELDYSEEVTRIIAGGEGDDEDREIKYADDLPRYRRSAFGWAEAYEDASEQEDEDGLTAAAYKALAAGRPKLRFAATLVESLGVRYGIHWRWGDKLTAMYGQDNYSCIVKTLRVQVDGNGRESIEARLEWTDS
jgi:hypothetical protein